MSISTPGITNFTAGELSPLLAGRVDVAKYFNGCRVLENFHVHPHGGVCRRSGLRYILDSKAHDRKSRLIPFEYSADQAYVLELGHEDLRVFTEHGYVLDPGGASAPYERVMPYAEADLDAVDYTQSYDTLILVCKGYPLQKLTRLDHDDWALTQPAFEPETPCPTGVIGAMVGGTGTTEHKYKLTAMTDVDESLPSDVLTVLGPDEIDSDDDAQYVEITFDETDATVYVYKERNGIYGFLGKASGTTFKDDGINTPDTSSSVLEACNPFEDEANYPVACAMYDNRLWLATADGKVRGSRVGSYFDFRVGPPEREPADDEPIEETIRSGKGDSIEWLIGTNMLYIGTTGSVWVLGDDGEAITPGNARARHMTAVGTSSAAPVPVGFSLFYPQRSGKAVRSMEYSFEQDAYYPKDVTVLSRQVVASGVSELVYAAEPDYTLYGVCGNGQLACCTYMSEQDVCAWHRYVTDGAIESACVIHYNGEDELWVKVRRTIHGETRRFTELLVGVFDGDDVRDAFFVDSGVTFDLETATTAVSVPHLAGATVSILADGSVQPDAVVAADGTVTLKRAARRIHVGLPYVSTLRPMPLEIGSQRGTAQTKRKRITHVAVRFHKTVGGEVGPSEDKLRPLQFRTPSVGMGDPVPLYTGDKNIEVGGGWQTDADIIIRQRQPLPMSVLMIVPTQVINE